VFSGQKVGKGAASNVDQELSSLAGISKVNLDSQGSRERFEGARAGAEGGDAKRGNQTIDANRYNEIF